jgi:hypothetical protein
MSTVGEADSTDKCSKLTRREAAPVVFGPNPVRNPTLSVLKGDKAEGVMEWWSIGILEMKGVLRYWIEQVWDRNLEGIGLMLRPSWRDMTADSCPGIVHR